MEVFQDTQNDKTDLMWNHLIFRIDGGWIFVNLFWNQKLWNSIFINHMYLWIHKIIFQKTIKYANSPSGHEKWP